MEPRYKFSFGYFLLLFTLMLFLDSLFFSGPAVREISYSKFRDLIAKGQVQSVILEQDRIYGLEKAPAKADTSTPKLHRLQMVRPGLHRIKNTRPGIWISGGRPVSASRRLSGNSSSLHWKTPSCLLTSRRMASTTAARSNRTGFPIFSPTGSSP